MRHKFTDDQVSIVLSIYKKAVKEHKICPDFELGQTCYEILNFYMTGHHFNWHKAPPIVKYNYKLLEQEVLRTLYYNERFH